MDGEDSLQVSSQSGFAMVRAQVGMLFGVSRPRVPLEEGDDGLILELSW